MRVEDVRRLDKVRFYNWTWTVYPRPITKNCPDLACLAGGNCGKVDHVSWEVVSPVATARQVYAPVGMEIESV